MTDLQKLLGDEAVYLQQRYGLQALFLIGLKDGKAEFVVTSYRDNTKVIIEPQLGKELARLEAMQKALRRSFRARASSRRRQGRQK